VSRFEERLSAGRARWRRQRRAAGELGQSTVVVAIGVILMMALLGSALTEWSYGQQNNAQGAALQRLALQAAQAGFAEYQSLYTANPRFPDQYCSQDQNASSPPAGQTWSATCATNGQQPANVAGIPAFVDWFNEESFAPGPNTNTNGCQGSALNSQALGAYNWASANLVSGISTGYQYVVDSSRVNPANGAGTVYIYVTGRAGRDGDFVCTTLANSIQVQGSLPPPTATLASDTTAPITPQNGGSVTSNSQEVQFTLAGGSGSAGGGMGYAVAGGVGEQINASFIIPSADEIITTAGQQGTLGGVGGSGYVTGGTGSPDAGGSGGGGGATGACLVANGNPLGLTCVAGSGPTNVNTLCTSNAPAQPCVLAIAGGGGGAGDSSGFNVVGGVGGNGGYITGQTGQTGVTTQPGLGGGGGNWNGFSDSCPGGVNPPNGIPGAAGADVGGGAGEAGFVAPACDGGPMSGPSGGNAIVVGGVTLDGGAGGGGYMGGGSGSAGVSSGGGGGGGGASYLDTDALVPNTLATATAPYGNGSASAPVYSPANTATTTWTYSAACGTSVTVQVPATAIQLQVKLSGAGGGGGSSPIPSAAAGNGGPGSTTTVSFPVSSWGNVYVNEGCGGGGGSGSTGAGGVAPAVGGWGIGGDGGTSLQTIFQGGGGGAGGAASAVCLGAPCSYSNAASNPLVVAGGGGGGGAVGAQCALYPDTGGTGGTGGTGAPGAPPYQVAGGNGGPGVQNPGEGVGVPIAGPGGVAAGGIANGTAGIGGINGTGGGIYEAQGAGGGGGGWAGGGGGGGVADDCNGSAGGGGGSSFAAAIALAAPVFSPGAIGGGGGVDGDGAGGNNGTIVLTWTIAAPVNAAGTTCVPVGVQASSTTASGQYTAEVAAGGGAPSISAGNGNSGEGGPGGLLDVSLQGLGASQPLAAIAGCQGTGAVGGVGYTNGGSSGPNSCTAYDAAVLGAGPTGYFQLNDLAGTTHPFDSSGNPGTSGTVTQTGGTGSVVFGQTGGPINCFNSLAAVNQGPDDVAQFNAGVNGGYVATSGPYTACAPSGTQPLTIAVWFRANQPGGLVGCDGGGSSGQDDRFLYIGNSGHLDFGATATTVVSSIGAVTDNLWHFAVATFGPDGTDLYLDGQPVARDPGFNTLSDPAGTYGGTWDIGQTPSAPQQWPDAPSMANENSFHGELSRAAFVDYPLQSNGQGVMSAHQVSSLFADGSQACVVDLPLSQLTSGTGGAFWELNDQTSAITDYSGNGNTGTAQGSVTTAGPSVGPLPCQTVPNYVTAAQAPTWTASEQFNNTGLNDYVSTTTQYNNPQNFTISAWFNTSDPQGGGIMGFGNIQLGANSTTFDRNLYVGQDGHLLFGDYDTSPCPVTGGHYCVVESPQAVNDGNWHMAVASSGPAGEFLYLDGQLVGWSPNTTAETNNGWWQIGEIPGFHPSWPDESGAQGNGDNFNGQIGRVSFITSQLPVSSVVNLYEDSGYSPGSASCSAYDGAINAMEIGGGGAYWPLDDQGTTAADISPSQDTGTVNGTVTQGAGQGPLNCNPNSSGTVFDGSTGWISTNTTFNNPQNFSVAGWFKTTGSGIITSFAGGGNFDRYLWVGASGLLNWETDNAGTVQVVRSNVPVNDGNWHYAVASIGPAGQDLYVDGQLSAYNTNFTQAGNYNGTWSIGYAANRVHLINTQLDEPTQSYFAGALGRIAVVPQQLTSTQVQSLYADSGATTPPTTVCDPTLQPNPSSNPSFDEMVLGMNAPALLAAPNAAAFYPLDEQAGIKAVDLEQAYTAGLSAGSIGAGQHQAPATGPFAQCPADTNAGGAMTFDGSSPGFVSANAVPTYNGALTEMAWIKMNPGQSGGIIGLTGGENDHFLYIGQDSQIYFDVGNSAATTAGSNALLGIDINDGNWHLVAGEVVPGHGTYIYVDGDLVGYGPQSPGVNPPTATDIQVGAIETATPTGCSGSSCPAQASFNGTLSRAAVLKEAMPQQDLRTLYSAVTNQQPPPPSGNPNLNCFNNSQTGTAYAGNPPNEIYPLSANPNDLVSGRNGTSGGQVNFSQPGGPLTGCDPAVDTSQFRRNGNSYISLPASTNQAYNTGLTVEAWVNLTYGGGSPYEIVGTPAVGNNNGWQLNVDNGDANAWFEVGTPAATTVNLGSGPGNGWHFLVGTYDGSHVSIYLDGALVASQAAAGTVGIGTNPPEIGNGTTKGDISDVAIYPSALSAGAIAGQYMEATLPINAPPSLTTTISTTNPAASGTCAAYDAAVQADDPLATWNLTDTGGGSASPNVVDQSNNANSGTFQGSVPVEGINPGPLGCSAYSPAVVQNAFASPAMQFGGATYVETAQQYNLPNGVSVAAWFETTSGGGIISFGHSQTGQSGNGDRLLYVGQSGDLDWGVKPSSGPHNGTNYVISSPNPVNDGRWHFAVGTIGPNDNTQLFLDGKLVASGNANQAHNASGFFQIGDLTPAATWPDEPNVPYSFNGEIGRVAVFPSELSGTQVHSLNQAAGNTAANNPEAQNTCSSYDAAVLANGPRTYLELNDTTGLATVADSSGGFNTGLLTGSGQTENNPGPLNCLLANPGSPMAPSMGLQGTGAISNAVSYTDPENFTVAVWFKDYTSEGGLVSFQGTPVGGGGVTGDRMLYVGNDGHVYFGINHAGTPTTVTSTAPVQDGNWHLAVGVVCGVTCPAGTQANGTAAGMYLYVDGVQQGFVNAPNAADLFGQWQVGTLPPDFGTLGWANPPTSADFTGFEGRASVIPTAMSAQQVALLYDDAYNGLGGGGGAASALCLENPGNYNPAAPSCSASGLSAAPQCQATIAGWGTAAGPTACLLAVAGGGGGGGYASASAPVTPAVCTLAGTVGGDGGPVASLSGSAGTGQYIPGGNDSAGSNGATGAVVAGGTGTAGTFGIPTASGGGGAGYTGGSGGSTGAACGGGGASTWYATSAPGPAGSSITVTPILNGPNTCQFAASGYTDQDCSGFVNMTGPLAPPTSITLLASHVSPTGTVQW